LNVIKVTDKKDIEGFYNPEDFLWDSWKPFEIAIRCRALDRIEKGIRMDIQTINNVLDEIEQDRTVPRNIRTAVQNVKVTLNNQNLESAVRINTAISTLDEVSNDPNIPTYTRTQIWNLVSMLEVLNEEIKKASFQSK